MLGGPVDCFSDIDLEEEKWIFKRLLGKGRMGRKKLRKDIHEAEESLVHFEILIDVLMFKLGCEKYRCHCYFTSMKQ